MFSVFTILAACLVDTARGPDLGACAEAPEGVYNFGEAGIGRCLAGPSDLAFVDIDGALRLAVVNADPWYNFDSGSLLLVDPASLDLNRAENLSHEITSEALPLDRFASSVGLASDRPIGLVTGRLSEGAPARAAEDDVALVDLRSGSPELLAPGALTLQDDPGPVVVHSETLRAYVGNLTDHSVTVLDLGTDEVHEIPVAGEAVVSLVDSYEIDGSGSTFELVDSEVYDPELAVDDTWVATFVEAAWRFWIPETDGLALWTSGDGVTFERSAFGVPDGLLGLVDADPAAGLLLGIPVLYTAAGGNLLLVSSDGTPNGWNAASAAVNGGDGICSAWLSGPSPALVDELPALFHESRTAAGEPASIALATSEDGFTYRCEATDLGLRPEVAGVDSIEDPSVLTTGPAQVLRMWMGLRTGDIWSIGLSESEDGRTWSTPEVVYDGLGAEAALVGADYGFAAPHVAFINGRYQMTFTTSVAGVAWTAVADSSDGWSWSLPLLVAPAGTWSDPWSPPRVAVQFDGTSFWRIEGVDQGLAITPLIAGVDWIDLTRGYAIRVASGHVITGLDLWPGSVVQDGGAEALFVTTDPEGAPDVALLRPQGATWDVTTGFLPSAGAANRNGSSDPVALTVDGTTYLYYAGLSTSGTRRIALATTTDLSTFTHVESELVAVDPAWDDAEQVPHSTEILANGQVRLWTSGFDGSTWRIGSALAPDADGPFVAEAGEFDPWVFGTGLPGSIDDSGVRDPMVAEIEGVRHLWYSAFDGAFWHIGHAVDEGGEWVRRTDAETELTRSAASGFVGTYTTAGVRSPTLRSVDAAGARFWVAGTDGLDARLGMAHVPLGRQSPYATDAMFLDATHPTVGDGFTYTTTRSSAESDVIELSQSVEEFVSPGTGMSSMALDEERGLLYVTSKLEDYVYVVDIDGDVGDANVDDLEGLMRVSTVSTAFGFRDVLVVPQHDWLLLLADTPDAVVVLPRSVMPDDADKEVELVTPLGILPLPGPYEDVGERSFAPIAGAGMAVSPDGSLLLVAHFRGNRIHVFDLTLGDFGVQIAEIPYVGENPHLIAFHPDGQTAWVANYVGEVEDDVVHSNLAIIDTNPASPTYLTVLTRLVNR